MVKITGAERFSSVCSGFQKHEVRESTVTTTGWGMQPTPCNFHCAETQSHEGNEAGGRKNRLTGFIALLLWHFLTASYDPINLISQRAHGNMNHTICKDSVCVLSTSSQKNKKTKTHLNFCSSSFSSLERENETSVIKGDDGSGSVKCLKPTAIST